MVISTSISFIFAGFTDNRSWQRIARSASFPAVIEPFSLSLNSGFGAAGGIGL
jgi:hypothetical protein